MEKEKKSPIIKGIIGILIILVIIAIIVILLKTFTKNKNISTRQEDFIDAGSPSAEKMAIKDISKEANVGVIKAKELSCNSEEVIDSSIVVIECITTNQKVINHFESKTIYYIYQKTEDDYIYSINKVKEQAIKDINNFKK